MPVASFSSSKSGTNRALGSNLAYDANRRRLVHGPLQPMDADPASARWRMRAVWQRLFRA